MLQLTQLIGNAQKRLPPVRARYIGAYALSAADPSLATILGADMQYAPGPYRQLVLCTGLEVPLPVKLLCGGRRFPCIARDGASFSQIWAGPAPDAGDYAVSFDVASGTEASQLFAFEVEYAAPAFTWPTSGGPFASAAVTQVLPLEVPDGALIICNAFHATDTVNFTFTGTTEVVDVDAGVSRNGAGIQTTPSVGLTRPTVSVTTAGATAGIRGCAVAIPPYDFRGVKHQVWNTPTLMANADPSTQVDGVNSNMDLEGTKRGKYLLTLYGETSATVSSVTLGGNAMTRIGQVVNTGPDPDLFIEVWSIDFDPAVNFDTDISIDLSGTPGASGIVRISHVLYDVGSVGTAQSTSGNATGAALAVDVAEGGMILACTIRSTSGQTTTWTGVEERVEAVSDAGFSMGFRQFCAAETGRTVQAVGSASGQYATLAIAFNP